jgi:site-specific recombinase XerD
MVMGNPLDEPFLAEWFNWPALRFQHTTWIRSRLSDELAPASANKCLSALKGVLKACWRLDLMTAEDYHRAIDLGQVRGTRLPPGRQLALGEMRAFFEDCAKDRSRGAVLDAALFAALAGGGLRRGEVTALDVENFDGDGEVLRVRGKGNKEREVPLASAAVAAISLWVNVRGFEEGALFCPVRKGDKLEVRRMSDQAVYKRLERRALRAGIKGFTPHDLRRTYASGMMEGGADIVAVQKLLGHADISTTVKYDRRDEKVKRKAAELFHLPYVAFEPQL